MFFYVIAIMAAYYTASSLYGPYAFENLDELEALTWALLGLAIALSLWQAVQCIRILNQKVQAASTVTKLTFAANGALFGPIGVIIALLTPAERPNGTVTARSTEAATTANPSDPPGHLTFSQPKDQQ